MTQPLHVPLQLATLLAATVLIVGCSAPQTVTEDTGEGQQVTEDSSAPAAKPSKAPGKATLKKAGFGLDGDYGWVSAIVTNTSSGNVGKFVTVQFNLMDAKGKLVASQDQVEQFTSADQTLVLGTQVDMAGKRKVAKVEATLGLGERSSIDDMPNLPVGNVKVKKTEYDGPQAVFEVKNPGRKAQKSARVGVVCFNKVRKNHRRRIGVPGPHPREGARPGGSAPVG